MDSSVNMASYDPGFSIELEQEDDGRWIAEIAALSGALSYGATKEEATRKVEALALRFWLTESKAAATYPRLRVIFWYPRENHPRHPLDHPRDFLFGTGRHQLDRPQYDHHRPILGGLRGRLSRLQGDGHEGPHGDGESSRS